ncbi:unnamed protein product [Durusdinium trenchii]|uniref:Copia protein n=1 Tax=Durusdinium trenchii TaxID=1381693 RepID=A0ABP0RPL9_9DINO
MEAAKDEKLFRCSWNGDVSTFQDYVRRVRLAFSRTKKKHRKHLAADLVSQLTGRAWTITQEISHERLVKEDGAKYLVQFLESHLARVPVPDAGAKAEELLVKLRRPFGMSMSTWCATVREHYRQLQRALKRAAPLNPSGEKDTTPKRSPSVPSTSSPPSPARSSRRTSKRTVPEPEAPDEEEDDEDDMDFEYPDSPDGDDPGEESDARRQWHGRGRKAKSQKSDSSDDDDMQWGVRLWGDMDSSLPEEELRLHERDPEGRGKGKGSAHRQKPRANFWVEQDGEWGLLIDDQEANEWLEDGAVHWVGHDLSTVYASMDEGTTRTPEVQSRPDSNGFWHQDEDGGYTFWNKATDGEYYSQDQAGTFWAWSDFEDDQVWWSATPEQQKEISEAYANYEGKVRSFAESRALLRHKNLSRGFYPKKGKGKGKPSSFSKGKGAKAAPMPTFVVESPGPSNDVFAASGTPGSAGYTGCFVCGSKGHTFRNCPSRSNTSSSSKGSGKIFMVAEVEEHYESEIPEVSHRMDIPQILSSEVLQPELQGYGVLDTGATESVSSLAALEFIHLRRTELLGHGNHVTVIPGPQKMFRFGNGSLQFSESYVHLKQTVGPHEIDLGVFTLDSKGVPLLIGVRTLERLGMSLRILAILATASFTSPHGGNHYSEEDYVLPSQGETNARGTHDPAPPGRGSPTGSNAHAYWVACNRCQLRLLYVPSYGAHGLTRAAGPLPSDAAAKVKELGNSAAYSPEMRNKNVGLDAAENSFMKRLEVIRAQKEQHRQGKPETKPKAKATQGYIKEEPPRDPEVMSQTPGRKVRKPEDAAELLEYQNRSEIQYKAEETLDLGAVLSKYDLIPKNVNMDPRTVLLQNDTVLENLAMAMSSDLQQNELVPDYDDIENEVPDYLLEPLKYYEAPGEEQVTDDEHGYGPEKLEDLAPEDQNFIEETLQEKRLAFEDCLASCSSPTLPEKLDLMELCCEEDSLITRTWRSSGGKAGRMGLFNHCNLLTDAGTQEAIRLVQLHRPEILWVAFPCGATSPLQHLNELTPEGRKRSQRRKARSRRLIKNGIKVIEAQLNQGGEIVQEWPLHNEAWKFDIVKDLWNALSGVERCEDVLLDGCQFGLKSPQGEFMKKPWRLRSSRPGMMTSMGRRCDGRHQHTPVMGGDLAKRTALYTPAMCRAACRCFNEFLSQSRVFGALEVKIDREGLKTLTEKELAHLAETALKLHRLCGHPGSHALVRTLAAKGADGKLLAVAEQLKCMECLEGTMKKPSPKVSLEKEQKLWRTLQIDAFVLKKGDAVHHFLLMLDEASGFSVVHEMMSHSDEQHENITAQATLDALVQCWFQYFGTPACLRCDLEGAFRGDLLETFCKSRDIELSFVPAEHHEATGDVERAIGELKKKMLAYLRQDNSAEPRLAAYEMCAAHNRFARVSGFSPIQWAFGRDLSDDTGLATLSAAGDPTSEMNKNLQLRLDAEAQYRKMQGQDTQRARDIYITPVPELAEQLSCKPGECAKMLKAAYSLVSAPREWYGEVNNVITTKLGMKRLTTDGCVWILQDPKSQETLGYVASHVDDFLISGSPDHPLWQKTVEAFKGAFSWSPWESTPFTHCGIGVSQEADWSFRLSHHTFVEELRPIVIDDKSEMVTAQEMNQARALLGAMQWRSIQTGPQHSSKVSWLQSSLPKGGKDVLHQINKLSREMHHQRYLSVSTRQLGAESVDDIGFVCYTDAAVANRPNFASTGRHLVGMVHRHQVWAASFDPEFVAAKKKKGKTSTTATSHEPDEGAEFDEDLSWRDLISKSKTARSETFHEEFLGHVGSFASAFECSLQDSDVPARLESGTPSARVYHRRF